MIERYLDFSIATPTANISHCADPITEYERVRSLAFHIKTGDFFRFHTTLLGFIEETLSGAEKSNVALAIQLDAIRSARKDMHDLSEHYSIEPRR